MLVPRPYGELERRDDGIVVKGAKVDVTLPVDATKPFVLGHAGARVAVRSLGATKSAARIEDGAVFYPSAIGGGTWTHVPLADGTEELLELAAPPTPVTSSPPARSITCSTAA